MERTNKDTEVIWAPTPPLDFLQQQCCTCINERQRQQAAAFWYT